MKLFISETGSDKMRIRYAELRNEPVFVSALALVEASSAVFRLRKSGSILEPHATAVTSAVTQEVQALVNISIDQALLEDAARLTAKHFVRALDAIQLASALQARMIANDSSMQFICSDRSLLTCAAAEHFPIWDPCS